VISPLHVRLDSPLILGVNPNPIPVGGSLKYICPLVAKPPASRPGQRQVTPFGPVFQVDFFMSSVNFQIFL
jgi:hypothetical protein